MSGLDDLLKALETLPGDVDLRYELRTLRAIRAWAIEQLGLDYEPGDRVVICSPEPSTRGGGWTHYSEALAIGQTGIATKIEFSLSSNAWYVTVGMDRAWSVSDNGEKVTRHWRGPADLTPEGFEPPSEFDQEYYPNGQVKHFYMKTAWVKKFVPEPEEEPMGDVTKIRLYETADGDAAAIDEQWVNNGDWAELDALADRLKKHAAELREKYLAEEE